MKRHNWGYDWHNYNQMQCSPRIPLTRWGRVRRFFGRHVYWRDRKDGNCFGCDAKIEREEHIAIYKRTGKEIDEFTNAELDRIWVSLQPCGELVLLVEEASCQ